MPLRGALLFAAVVMMLVPPRVTLADVDLTGEWVAVITPDETFAVHIVQNGSTLLFNGSTGIIDPRTGKFEVPIQDGADDCGGPPITLYGTMADLNHYFTQMGGYVRWPPAGPCQWLLGGGYSLVRVNPLPTPSPSPSPTPTRPPLTCVGDCNRDGRVTIHELMQLVKCHSPILTIAVERCGVDCADVNGSNTVEVNEIVTAVNNALRGCP